MIRARILVLLVAAASIGCASSGSGTGKRPSSQVITQQEIADSGLGETAFEVISRLRPNFLTSRGQTSLSTGQAASAYPNVYVDGLAYGDINTLKNINAMQIAEIRLYQAWEAQTKFGLGNNAGVIAITIRK
jgi:hypothetical protein